ncbi:MAG: hypothetical protein ABSE93_12780 [Terriglobia bacterium]
MRGDTRHDRLPRARIIAQQEPHPWELEEVVVYSLELLTKIRVNKTS